MSYAKNNKVKLWKQLSCVGEVGKSLSSVGKQSRSIIMRGINQVVRGGGIKLHRETIKFSNIKSDSAGEHRTLGRNNKVVLKWKISSSRGKQSSYFRKQSSSTVK